MSTEEAPPNSRIARRRALLEIATDLFLENGYDHTTLDMIVERAGGSKSTIYAHYGSKEGLYAAIVDDLIASVVSGMDGILAENQNLESALRSFGLAYLEGLSQPRNVQIWRLMAAQSARFPEVAARAFDAGPKRVVEELAELLARAEAAGEISVADPQRAAEMFLGSLRSYDVFIGQIVGVTNAPSSARRRKTVDEAIDVFLNGVASPN